MHLFTRTISESSHFERGTGAWASFFGTRTRYEPSRLRVLFPPPLLSYFLSACRPAFQRHENIGGSGLPRYCGSVSTIAFSYSTVVFLSPVRVKTNDSGVTVLDLRCARVCPSAHGRNSMKRRESIALLGSAAAGWPLAARSQQPGKLRTIGYFGTGTPSAQSQWTTALVQWLSELDWIEDHTVAVEHRWA
jgi:hypothetical protein